MPIPPHAVEWMNRAEIDYLGPFVKAWAAFNSWYRQASGQAQERAMLNYAVSNANSSLRRRVLPLLSDANTTADAVALKQAIGDLQFRLDAIHFEVTRKNGSQELVSLRAVCLRPRQLTSEITVRNSVEYRAQRVHNGIEVKVVSQTSNTVRFQCLQAEYNPTEVYSHADFDSRLSPTQQANLRQFYDSCNPRPMTDLVQGRGPALQAGTIALQCLPEDLLAGLVETIYTMRNALLHGEVDPDPHVLACYEPAYRIVMHFLKAIQ